MSRRTSQHKPVASRKPLWGPILLITMFSVLASSVARPETAMTPTGFIENRGQFDADVLFYLPGSGAGVFFTSTGLVFDLAATPTGAESAPKGRCAVTAAFRAAGSFPKVVGRSPLTTRYNYFLGNREEDWRTDVPSFEEIVYVGVWPGVDLSFRCEGGELAYELESTGEGEPARAAFDYSGADEVIPLTEGMTRIETPLASITERRAEGGAQGTFSVGGSGDGTDGFAALKEGRLGLVWSTFLGGSDVDNGRAVAVDPWDVPLIAGHTYSPDFPATMGYDQSHNGNEDCFVARFLPDGSALEWATYIGGSGDEATEDLTMVTNWFPVITGWTLSTDFPVTPGAFDMTPNGGTDAFVVQLAHEGNSLRCSTYLGGSLDDEASALASMGGLVVVAGKTLSMDFPTTAGAYDISYNFYSDAFVTELDPVRSELTWSTFLGGGDDDRATGLAMDATRDVVVTGLTESFEFPTTPGAFDQTHNGSADAFVLKLRDDGTSLLWGTFYGGTASDEPVAVALDAENDVVFAGYTTSFDYPVTPGAYQTTYGQGCDAFVTKLLEDGSSPAFSTFLGGEYNDQTSGLCLDSYGCPIVAGFTYGHFPTTPDAYDQTCISVDGFVSRLDNQGQTLLYSSYLGGSSSDYIHDVALEPMGRDVFVAGMTSSSDFPVTPGAFDETRGGVADAFLTQMDLPGPRLWLIHPDGSGDAPTVQAGIDSAQTGDFVLLAPGTFHEHDIQLRDYVRVLGQYHDPLLSIIDAQGLGRVISATDVDHAQLGHITLTGGRATTGGGLHLLRSDLDVFNCIIRDNQATGGLGAGIALSASSGTIIDCVIMDNHALGNGYGGGVSCAVGSAPGISRCVIARNTSFYGGGLYSTSASAPALYSCTFHGNSDSGYGGGVASTNASASLENTIVAESAGGSAVYCGGGGSATLSCCDLHGNAGGDWVGCVASQYGTNGNISADPLFWDATDGDYHLRVCSPCARENAPGDCGLIGAWEVDDTRAKIWRLTTDGSGDAPTIQAALDQSCEGDSVLLACGTYMQGGIDMRSGVVVRSETGDPNCAIVQAPFGGSVIVCNHVDATARLEALTVTGGTEGGVHCSGGSPTIVDCIITGNEGDHGAGVVCLNRSDPSLQRCEITYNTATGSNSGAGVYCADDSEPTLTECIIAHNTAASGATIYSAAAQFLTTITIDHCTITDNTTSTRSSAVYTEADVSMGNSIITFTSGGAAVRCGAEGEATLTCCDLFGNAGGDWAYCVEDQEGHGNISLDPLFCLEAHPEDPYALDSDSPCAAGYNPSCGQIGARGIGCGSGDAGEPNPCPLFLVCTQASPCHSAPRPLCAVTCRRGAPCKSGSTMRPDVSCAICSPAGRPARAV